MSEWPECEKMKEVQPKSQAIGQFLEWLNEQGIFLAEYPEDDSHPVQHLVIHRESTEKILARYFNINLDKVEEEKRRMLDQIRLSH